MGIRKSEVKMNGYVIVLLVAAAAYSASGFAFFHPAGQQDAEHCTEDEGIRAINWDTTCSRFFQCVDGLWTVRSCKTGTVIDLTTGRCTHPDNTVEWIRPECRDKAREDKLEEEAALLRQEQERFPFGSLTGEGSDPDASNTAPYVGLNPYSCIGHNPHVPIAHRDCSKYRQCVSGFWQTRECNPGTVFDVSKLRCAHRHLAWGCGIQAENSYKKQLEEWKALAEQAEKDLGPTEPTVFSSFDGSLEDPGRFDFPEANEFLPVFQEQDDLSQLPSADQLDTLLGAVVPQVVVPQVITTEAAFTVEHKPALSIQDALTVEHHQPAASSQDVPAQTAAEPVKADETSAPRAGSPCFGPQLFPVTGDCSVYLECAPDALSHSLLPRQCPANTYFEPATNQCDYKEQLQRTDCDGTEQSSTLNNPLPSADILQDFLGKK